MKKRLLRVMLLLLVLMVTTPLTAYFVGNAIIVPFAGAPSGGCAFIQLGYNSSTGDLYWCKAGTWTLLGTSSALNFVITSVANNDVLTYSSGAGAWVNGVPGLATSRTVSGASATLDCSNATGDRNKVLTLSNAGAIALTGFTPGAGCPDGATIFVDVQGAAAVATLTPASGNCNGASTCTLLQGFWRIRSDGSQTFANLAPRSATVPYPAAGTSVTMSASGYYKCSGACNVTFAAIPGNQYCVRNADNVSSAITLVNVSGIQFEATARTSYYAANRKLVSGGAVTDQACYVVASDGTHFDHLSSTGTWTDTAP